MKKFSKLLVAAVLALSLGLTAAGCGGNGNTGGDNPGGNNPGGDNPGGNTGVTATLDFYTSVNIIEQSALQQVANAYSDMQYEKGNDITIMIRNNTDPAAYMQTLRTLVSNGVKNPTIANTSVVDEYYGTDKILDLSGYLEEPNPYIEGNAAWMDALEEDAYQGAPDGRFHDDPRIELFQQLHGGVL